MMKPDDSGQVALSLLRLAMEWIEARVDVLPAIPSVMIYPTYRNVTISFGYYARDSEALAKIVALFSGFTATRKNDHSCCQFSVGDEKFGILFRWNVWRTADDTFRETEVTL